MKQVVKHKLAEMGDNMEDFKKRLITEHKDLKEKYSKIQGYIVYGLPLHNADEDFQLIVLQSKHMYAYLEVLEQRMKLLGLLPK